MNAAKEFMAVKSHQAGQKWTANRPGVDVTGRGWKAEKPLAFKGQLLEQENRYETLARWHLRC